MGPDFARKPKVIIADLVETASAAGTFQVQRPFFRVSCVFIPAVIILFLQTLLAACTAAGLVDTLKGEAQLTVLAPSGEGIIN